MVLVQIFIAAQPALHYLRYLDDLASSPFGGWSKQPWLFVELPGFGKEGDGEGR